MRIIAILLLALLSFASYSSATNQAECELCDFAVNYVEGLILKNKTQNEIVTELEKVCNLVSPNLKPTCDNVVIAYTDVIIKLIIMREPASTICEQIKLCPPPTNYFSDNLNTERLHQLKDGLIKKASLIGRSRYDDTKECSLCKLISGDIIVMVKQNKTQEEIISELNNACQLLKGFEKQCIEMVEQYVPTILNVIDSENPDEICQAVKLCSPQQQQQHQSNHHNFNNKQPIGNRVSISKNIN